MIHAYAFKADPAPLGEAGGLKTRLWYDADGARLKRAEMMKSGQLRAGDTLLILSIHNLAGSPQAYQRWRDDMATLGVTLRIVETDKPPKPVGRPKVYTPTARQARLHWATWIDGHRSEKDRLADVAGDYGAAVTRQTLNGRYGNPSNPGPAPDREG